LLLHSLYHCRRQIQRCDGPDHGSIPVQDQLQPLALREFVDNRPDTILKLCLNLPLQVLSIDLKLGDSALDRGTFLAFLRLKASACFRIGCLGELFARRVETFLKGSDVALSLFLKCLKTRTHVLSLGRFEQDSIGADGRHGRQNLRSLR
jgi:hypothetical protein